MENGGTIRFKTDDMRERNMNGSTSSKEFVFLRILNNRIARIDRLVNDCDPSALEAVGYTTKLMNEWKSKGNIRQQSVDKLVDRLQGSLNVYKEECELKRLLGL